MSKNGKVLLILLGIELLFIIQNIYINSILLVLWSIIITYKGIKNINNRKKSEKKVFNKVNMYCKQYNEASYIYYIYIPAVIFINSISEALQINVRYIIEHFYTALFVEQLKLIFIILAVIFTVLTIAIHMYIMFDSKKGIVYKEGLILDDGKLYKFGDVKMYEFNISSRGYKYKDVVLTYENESKIVCINKDDIAKFEDLLNKDLIKKSR